MHVAPLLAAPAAALAAYGGALIWLVRNETSLLFRPNRQVLDVAAAAIEGLRSVPVVTADGLTLQCWHLLPATDQPTILYLHGNGGNLMNRVDRLRRLTVRGCGLLAVEYRGYGGNPGVPTEDGLAADALGALNYLHAQNVADADVFLYGESLGTAVAARLAAQRKVAGVIMDSPYTSIMRVAQCRYPIFPIRILIRNRFELLGRVASIQAPLLVIQGSDDSVIPPSMGKEVFAAARQPKSLWIAPKGKHSNVLELGGETVVAAFIDRCKRRKHDSVT